AEIFARTLGQTPPAILDHAIAYGCLSASWHHEDGNAIEEGRELSIATAIRTVRLSP
ncbi:MAG: 3'-kinase, partial [Mesorhizobium sp.]